MFNWQNSAFLGYASRQSQLDEVATKLAAEGSKCNDFNVQCRIYDEVGLDSDTLTTDEIAYLEAEIAKRM